ncbi:hypothetical protein ABPG77_010281 [Micractinium sp. CCAP 211/92]
MAQEDPSPFALLQPRSEAANDELPVIVLLGWVGAQRDGALLKYADFLAEQGYASVRSVQPTGTAFSPFERPRRSWALALLSFLRARQLWPQRRLVLYAFSNGGAFVVEQLMLLAEQDRRFSQLRASMAAFVFDSAPAHMKSDSLQRVLSEAEPPGLGRALRATYYSTASWLMGRERRGQAFWANMTRLGGLGWDRPQLFLYSADDHLCDGAKLDELVAAKRAAGQRVSARRWQRSQHCGHFRRHREEYSQLLLDFLAGLQAESGAAQASGSGGGGGSAGGSVGVSPRVGPRARL